MPRTKVMAHVRAPHVPISTRRKVVPVRVRQYAMKRVAATHVYGTRVKRIRSKLVGNARAKGFQVRYPKHKRHNESAIAHRTVTARPKGQLQLRRFNAMRSNAGQNLESRIIDNGRRSKKRVGSIREFRALGRGKPLAVRNRMRRAYDVTGLDDGIGSFAWLSRQRATKRAKKIYRVRVKGL